MVEDTGFEGLCRSSVSGSVDATNVTFPPTLLALAAGLAAGAGALQAATSAMMATSRRGPNMAPLPRAIAAIVVRRTTDDKHAATGHHPTVDTTPASARVAPQLTERIDAIERSGGRVGVA